MVELVLNSTWDVAPVIFIEQWNLIFWRVENRLKNVN